MRTCSSSFPHSFWFFIVLAFLFYHCCLAHKNTSDILCIKKEKAALLKFKHDLVDPANHLVSWGSEEDDCCKWTGIICDIYSGNVQEIHLGGPKFPLNLLSEVVLYVHDPLLTLSGKLNPSLLSLEKLEYLDVSNNDFQGIQIPNFVGSLDNLRYLNLSNSNFSGEIPPQLGNLSKLHTLGLSNYGVLSSDLHWLSSLSKLQNLDMSYVDLSDVSNWLKMINSLPLVELRMSFCGLRSYSLDPIFGVNFSSLVLLDLSYNPDLGGIHLHNMTSLRKFYVSGNPFMNTPTVLRMLSSVGSMLDTLDIGGCHLSSSNIVHLQNMTSLSVLELSNNQLTKGIPISLGNLCNLRELRMSRNNFGEITISVILKTFLDCNSSKLESLQIIESNVSGRLPEHTGKLHNLVSLDLAENLLRGKIPSSIGSLSSLRNLDLSDNQLNGNIPPSIGQLFELESMILEINNLSGMVTEEHFANLSKLKVLAAANTGLTLKFHLTNWVPPFQLQYLDFNSWNLGAQFPLWLKSQTKLLYLDISHTGISDIIPSFFFTILPDSRVVDMSFNQIEGTISMLPAKLGYLDLSSNRFTGTFPTLSNNSTIYYLDLSKNSFSGSLKSLLCGKLEKSRFGRHIIVSNNNLSGVIPRCIKNVQGLSAVELENNNLSGKIPSSLGYLLDLQLLNMRNNKLVGKLPVSLMNLSRLKILQLSQNELMGEIPSWIGRGLTKLKILELRSNKFSGDIPIELCHLISLQVLDLAHNDLSGDVPTCFNKFGGMAGMEDVDQYISVGPYAGSAMIAMRGREDLYRSTLGWVTMLDLSNNNFSGPIPNGLTSLGALRSMSLSGNHLTGWIPGNIGNMKQIEYLDLSLNQLQGEIPVSLSDLHFLSQLNLSCNNLTGRIPRSTQIQGLDKTSFVGNRLCGPPLAEVCGDDETHDDDSRGLKQWINTTHQTDWGFVISILLGFAVGFWVVMGPLILSRSWRTIYFQILYNVMYRIYDGIFKFFV